MVCYYLSNKEEEIYKNFYAQNHFKENLGIKIVENGIIAGLHQEENNYWESVGIFDENGCLIPNSINSTCFSELKKLPGEPVKINKDAIFLGTLNEKWGHFILESISTLWYLMDIDYSDYDLVINVPENIPDNFFDLYELFGISKSRFTMNTSVLQYNRVIIPEQSFNLCVRYSNEYKNVIEKIKSKVEPINNDKIYFSREKYNQKGNFFGEKEISDIFKENGYKIFYPEQLSVVEQIGLLKGCKSFACINGSCAHNLIFANDNIEAIILERYSMCNTTQALINIMRNFKTYYVNSHYTFLPVASGWGPFIIGLNSFNSRFFDDKGFKYDKKLDEKINDYIIPYLIKWQKIFKNSKGVMNFMNVDKSTLREMEEILNIVFVENKTPFIKGLITKKAEV